MAIVKLVFKRERAAGEPSETTVDLPCVPVPGMSIETSPPGAPSSLFFYRVTWVRIHDAVAREIRECDAYAGVEMTL